MMHNDAYRACALTVELASQHKLYKIGVGKGGHCPLTFHIHFSSCYCTNAFGYMGIAKEYILKNSDRKFYFGSFNNNYYDKCFNSEHGKYVPSFARACTLVTVHLPDPGF